MTENEIVLAWTTLSNVNPLTMLEAIRCLRICANDLKDKIETNDANTNARIDTIINDINSIETAITSINENASHLQEEITSIQNSLTTLNLEIRSKQDKLYLHNITFKKSTNNQTEMLHFNFLDSTEEPLTFREFLRVYNSTIKPKIIKMDFTRFDETTSNVRSSLAHSSTRIIEIYDMESCEFTLATLNFDNGRVVLDDADVTDTYEESDFRDVVRNV